MNLRIKKITASTIWLAFLIGVMFPGYSNVLCVGADGLIKLETICLPGCTETEDFCEYNASEDLPNEHSDCTDCFDVELDNPVWSTRSNKPEFSQLIKLDFTASIDISDGLTPLGQYNLRFIKYPQLYNQNPPSLSLTTTILRC